LCPAATASLRPHYSARGQADARVGFLRAQDSWTEDRGTAGERTSEVSMSLPAVQESVALRRSRPAKFRAAKEAAIRLLCFLCALVSIVTTFGIIYVLLREAVLFFSQVSPI